MKKLKTWAGRSVFTYTGSVVEGTRITYGKSWSLSVSAGQYRDLLVHFRGRTVQMGTIRAVPPKGSVGEWLMNNVTKTAIASYVGAILVEEGYAERAGGPEIRF